MITLNYLEIEAHQRIGERVRAAEQHRLLKTATHSHQTSSVWSRAMRWFHRRLSLVEVTSVIKEAANEK